MGQGPSKGQRAATTGQHGAAVPAPAASAVASATTKTAGRGSGMAAVGNAAAGMEPAGMASMAASGAAAAAAAATGTAEAAAAGMMEVGKAAAGTEPAGMASMAAAGAAAAGTAATAYTGGAHAFAAGVAAASPAAAGTAAAAAGKASSLYDRLGGETLVLDTVEILYKKLLAYPLLSPFFSHINLFALKRHQMNFLSVAFGHSGSCYSGKTLAAAHGHLIRDHGLGEAQFSAMVRHLADTLDTLGKEQELVDEVMAIIGQYRCVFQAQRC